MGDPYIMLWGYGYDPTKALGFRKALKAPLIKPIEDRVMNRRAIAVFNMSAKDLVKDLRILRNSNQNISLHILLH